MATRTFVARFGFDTKQFTRGISEITDGLGKIPGVAQKVSGSVGRGVSAGVNAVAGVVTAAVSGVAALAGAAIMSGKSYNVLQQKSRAAFTTILGSADAATKMMDQLAEFSKTSPFPRQAFISATQQLLAFGFAAEDVVPTLGAIQDAVAATGGSAEQIGEITNVLAQVQSTGKFTAETLNQLGYRGIDAAKLIGQGMGQTAQQVRDSITSGSLDSQDALQTLVAEMTKTYDGAADGLKGTWEGATDRIKGVMRDVGSVLIAPFIDPKGGGYAITWANQLADVGRAVEASLGPALERGMSKVSPVLDKITPQIDRLVDGITAVSEGKGPTGLIDDLRNLAPVLAPVLAGLLALGGGNLKATLGPLGALVPAVSPLVAIIGALILVMPELRTAFFEAGQEIASAFAPVLPALVEALASTMPAIRELAVLAGGVLVGAVRIAAPLLAGLAVIVANLLPPVAQVVAAVVGTLVPALASVVGFVGDNQGVFLVLAGIITALLVPALVAWGVQSTIAAARNVAAWISTKIGALSSAAMQVLSLTLLATAWVRTAVSAVAAGARQVGAWVATSAGAVASRVVQLASLAMVGLAWAAAGTQSLLGAARIAAAWLIAMGPIGLVIALIAGVVLLIIKHWDTIKRYTLAAWSAVVSAISSALSGIRRIAGNIVGAVVGGFTSMKEKVSEAATAVKDKALSIFRGLRDGAGTIFTKLRDAVGGAFSAMLNKVKDPLRTLFSWMNRYMISPLNKVTKKFGVTIPDLPKFHTGGVIPGSGEKPIMALGGEGVVSPKGMKALGKRGFDAINSGKGVGGGMGGPLDFVKSVGSSVGGWLKKGAAFALGKIMDPIINTVSGVVPGPAMVKDLVVGQLRALKPKLASWGKKKDEADSASKTGPIGTGEWRKPLGRYSIGVGWNGYPGHTGQDFPGATGTPLYSPSAGRVSKVRRLNYSYGNHVEVDHGRGISTLQAHMSGIDTSVGKIVKAGEQIGRLGSTGNSTGPHDHFETRLNGRPVPPLPFMSVRGVKFDTGGQLRPGYTLAYNGTGKNETIRTREQEDALGAGMGMPEIRVFIGERELTDLVDVRVEKKTSEQARRVARAR